MKALTMRTAKPRKECGVSASTLFRLRRNRHLHGGLGGIHRRQSKNSGHTRFPAFIIAPRVAALRLRMLDEVEDFHLTLPRNFSAKNFSHGDGCEMARATTVGGANRVFQLGDVFAIRRHSPLLGGIGALVAGGGLILNSN